MPTVSALAADAPRRGGLLKVSVVRHKSYA